MENVFLEHDPWSFTNSAQNEDKARSDAIDREIEEESKDRRKFNILLLGTDPERSRMVKRMKIEHGLTHDERMHHRLTIYQNSLDSAQALVNAICDMGIEYADPMNHVNVDDILDYRIQHTLDFLFSPEIAEAIHQLWQDPVSPKVMDRRNEFWLPENAEYFFNEIIRIGSPNYVPTDVDILQAQDNVSPVIETRLTLDALQVNIIDVRNQRSSMKWMRCFADVPFILFYVSLSTYDQVLREDNCRNPLSDSFRLFDCIVNSRWFMHTCITLCLADSDVFKDKLSEVPLKNFFPDYTGGADVKEAIKYVRSRFRRANRAKLPIHFISEFRLPPDPRNSEGRYTG